MAFLSIYPRTLPGPGSSSTDSQRKGIAPITLLTSRSSACSLLRSSAAAVFPIPQVGDLWPCRPMRAAPTMSLKIEPR
jgi:hypothetical protein